MTIGDLLEIAVHYAPLGTVILAAVAVATLQSKVRQDRNDLRRKQAEIARLAYNDLLDDEYSVAALLMLDYEGWRYKTSDFEKQIELYFDDVSAVLLREPTPKDRPATELLVRRSIDSMFGKLEYVAALADRDIALLLWPDFAALFGYYIEIMRSEPYKDVLLQYANTWKFRNVVKIIENENGDYDLPAMKKSAEQGRQAQASELSTYAGDSRVDDV